MEERERRDHLEALQSMFLRWAKHHTQPHDLDNARTVEDLDQILSLATQELPVLKAIEAKLDKTVELLSLLPSAYDERGRQIRGALPCTRKTLWSILVGLWVGPDRVRTEVICAALLYPVRLTKVEERELTACIQQASIPKNRVKEIAEVLRKSRPPFQKAAYRELARIVECKSSDPI